MFRVHLFYKAAAGKTGAVCRSRGSVSVVLGAGQQGQLNQSLVVMVHYEHYVYTVFLYFPLYRFT